MKLTEEDREKFRQQIRAIILQRGLDPDKVDIEAALNNITKPLVLPNGEEMTFVEVAMPKKYGPYMRALSFLHTQSERFAATVERDFRMAETKLDDKEREDFAHASLHAAIDNEELLMAMLFTLMPCMAKEETQHQHQTVQ